MSQNLSSKGYRKTKRVIEKVVQEWGIKALKEPSRVRCFFNHFFHNKLFKELYKKMKILTKTKFKELIAASRAF